MKKLIYIFLLISIYRVSLAINTFDQYQQIVFYQQVGSFLQDTLFSETVTGTLSEATPPSLLGSKKFFIKNDMAYSFRILVSDSNLQYTACNFFYTTLLWSRQFTRL